MGNWVPSLNVSADKIAVWGCCSGVRYTEVCVPTYRQGSQLKGDRHRSNAVNCLLRLVSFRFILSFELRKSA